MRIPHSTSVYSAPTAQPAIPQQRGAQPHSTGVILSPLIMARVVLYHARRAIHLRLQPTLVMDVMSIMSLAYEQNIWKRGSAISKIACPAIPLDVKVKETNA